MAVAYHSLSAALPSWVIIAGQRNCLCQCHHDRPLSQPTLLTMDGPMGWPPTARKPSKRKVADRTSRRASTATGTPGNATGQTTSATAAENNGHAAEASNLPWQKRGRGRGANRARVPAAEKASTTSTPKAMLSIMQRLTACRNVHTEEETPEHTVQQESHAQCAKRYSAENARAHQLTHT